MNVVQGGLSPAALFGQTTSGLSDAQKQSLDEALSRYDAENLSDDDAKALVSEIRELEIPPGRALAEALGNVGIDARGLAQQAGIGGPEGGGKGGPRGGGGRDGAVEGAKGPDSAAVETLQSVVEQLQAKAEDSDTEEDFATILLQALENAGLDTSSPIVDYRV